MYPESQSLIDLFGAKKVVELLRPFVSARRQLRIENVLNNRLESIEMALEMPSDIHNAFAVIRSCEIFGVTRLHIIAPEKLLNGIRPISKGALDWIDIQFYASTSEFLLNMQKKKIRLAGAIATQAISVNEIPINEPLCLLLGNELNGLSAAIKQACDWNYQIPMFGMTESLNLSVAAAISLYETSRRKRAQLQASGDLNPSEWSHYQACYYLNSVNRRLIKGVFGKAIP
ncbi:MAG: hypothetical protein JSR33_12090, partial [Proteobacteria bacterium]|nr:hypothetical protein [Pseudomonadota bacterium]